MTRGQCLCGAHRFRLEGDLVFMHHCHCGFCRKSHGTAYGTVIGIDKDLMHWDAQGDVIAQAGEVTKFIPWQGPVVDRNGLQEWRDIIATMSERVAALLAQGSTVDEIIAAQPSRDFDAKWGGGRSPERFARDMHYVLTNAR